MHDHYMIPLLTAELAFWMIVAMLAMRETRAALRRVAELEAELKRERKR